MSRRFLLAASVAFCPAFLAIPASAHLTGVHAGMDTETHRQAHEAAQIALETHLSNRARQWSSTRLDISGRITPLRTWRSRSGHFCRAFLELVRLPSGVERTGRGHACRNEAGSWVRI
jgi:surface antigen